MAVVPKSNTCPRLVPTRTYRFDPRRVRTNVPPARHHAEQTARGAAVAAELLALQHEGFAPDLVVGHGGWGETLFVRDVWPDAHILLHAEFFYSAQSVLCIWAKSLAFLGMSMEKATVCMSASV